MKSKADKNLII